MIYGLGIIAILILSFLIEFALFFSEELAMVIALLQAVGFVSVGILTVKFEIFLVRSLPNIAFYLIVGIMFLGIMIYLLLLDRAELLELRIGRWKRDGIPYSAFYDYTCYGCRIVSCEAILIIAFSLWCAVGATFAGL